MKDKTYHAYLDSHERQLVIHSLVELKNRLIQEGRYRQSNTGSGEGFCKSGSESCTGSKSHGKGYDCCRESGGQSYDCGS